MSNPEKIQNLTNQIQNLQTERARATIDATRIMVLEEVLEKARELDKPGVHGWQSMKNLKTWLEEQLES